jgi:hypothetical protein
MQQSCREAMGSLTYAQRVERLKKAGDARTREARGEPVTLVPVVPESSAEFTDKRPDLVGSRLAVRIRNRRFQGLRRKQVI